MPLIGIAVVTLVALIGLIALNPDRTAQTMVLALWLASAVFDAVLL